MYLKKKKKTPFFFSFLFLDTVKHLQHLNYKISGTWPCISSIFGKLCLPQPLAKKLVWYLTFISTEKSVRSDLHIHRTRCENLTFLPLTSDPYTETGVICDRHMYETKCEVWLVYPQNRWHLIFPSVKSGVQPDLHTQEVTADLGTRGDTWPACLWE